MKLHLLFFISLILFSACKQTSRKLVDVESFLSENPDSALSILRTIDYAKLANNNDKAYYGVLLFSALDKSNQKLTPDSIINFSVEYYSGYKNKELLAKALYYKAKIYFYAFQYDKASKLYFSALDNMENSNNYEQLALIYSDLGSIFTSQGDLIGGRTNLSKAGQFFNKAGQTNDALQKQLDIAKTYRSEKKYTESQKQIRAVLTKTKDSTLLGNAFQELGVNYFFLSRYDSAIFYLKKSLTYPYLDFVASVRYFVLSDSYYAIASYDSAIYFAKKSLEYPANHYTRRETYRILANTEFLLKNHYAMARYMTRFQEFSDSVQHIERLTKIDVIEKIHNADKTVGYKNKQLILLILAAIVLIIVAFVFYFNSHKFKKTNRKLSAEAIHSLSDSKHKIEQNELQLQQNLKDIISKNRALQSELRKNLSLEERDRLDVEIYEKTLEINNREAFYQKMNNIYSNFISWLQKQHPDITDKEILFCSLEILEISNNHKIILLQTTENGLYKLKQRLAKKMNLSSTKDLNHYLKTRCAVAN